MYAYNGGPVFKILIPLGDECDLERVLKGSEFKINVAIEGGFKRIAVLLRVDNREENVAFLRKIMKGYGFDEVSSKTVSEFWDVVQTHCI